MLTVGLLRIVCQKLPDPKLPSQQFLQHQAVDLCLRHLLSSDCCQDNEEIKILGSQMLTTLTRKVFTHDWLVFDWIAPALVWLASLLLSSPDISELWLKKCSKCQIIVWFHWKINKWLKSLGFFITKKEQWSYRWALVFVVTRSSGATIRTLFTGFSCVVLAVPSISLPPLALLIA